MLDKFFNFLEKIRQRPEHERIRIAYAVTAVSFVLIFFVWIFSLKETIKSASDKGNKNDVSDYEFSDIRQKIENNQKSIEEMVKDQNTEVQGNEMNNDESGINDEMPLNNYGDNIESLRGSQDFASELPAIDEFSVNPDEEK